MRKLSAILLLFAGFLCLSTCEAKCQRKNPTKLKRSLNLAISSDKINNRHQAGLRKIFRRKRNINELKESDKFTAEIKFLQKWNPAMSEKDGSAYRLFEGNVLDAILEQMNADRRFINSYVLDLKKSSDGILGQVGFHFRKSEHNPISHVRFLVSRGHLSSLKVDKHYFKLLKAPAKFSNDNDKTSTPRHQAAKEQTVLQSKPSEPKQELVHNSSAHQVNNESPSASVSSQARQPDNRQPASTYETLTPLSNENPNQTQGNQENPQNSATQNQASTQGQVTKEQNQDNIQGNTEHIPNQNTAQVTNQEQAQEAGQVLSQNTGQGQNNPTVKATDNIYSSNQAQTQDQNAAAAQQQSNPQNQNGAVYPQAEQPSAQITHTSQIIPNPSNDVNGAQTQSSDQLSVGNQNQPNLRPADNQRSQVSSRQDNQKKQEPSLLTASEDEENISIKMNQAWYPFLSNHDSPQYKMLTGNLEKGLKSVMGDDTNIKDIKVKNLVQSDGEHTTVEFLLKFNGAGKERPTEKLRNIVKSGDIAGISVDASFFKIEDNKVVAQN